MERVERKIKLNFYKESGKWYSSGEATVFHYQFEDEYKQEIINTQNALIEGWQDHDNFYVATTALDENVHAFDETLYHPGAFRGLKRQETNVDKEKQL